MSPRQPPPPIDRGWAWMIPVGFFLYVFFMVGLAKSYGLLMAKLIQEFHVSTAYAATPITLCLITYAFIAPVAILIAHHYTIQKVVIVGAIVGFVGISLSSLMVNMLYFTIIFGIFYGIGNACFYGNGMILIGKYFRHHRSFANGLALSGASIGQFALPPIIEYLLENYGLKGTILITGAMYLHGAISGCLFRPMDKYASLDVPVATAENGDSQPMLESAKNEDIQVENQPPSYDELDHEHYNSRTLSARMAKTGSIYLVACSVPDVNDEETMDLPKKSPNSKAKSVLVVILQVLDFRMLRSYITLFYTVVSFLCFFGYFNFILFLPSIMIEKGITRYDKAMILSICGAGDLAARLSVSFFADRNIIARYKIKAISCLLCALNIFMFLFADSFAWLGIHGFLYGFFGGSYVCMLAVVLVDFVGLASMGQNLAVILFIQGIGSACGQPLLGKLKDLTDSFDVIIIFCGIFLGTGAIILFFYPCVQRWEANRLKKLNKAEVSS